jgi:gamma-glutamylcyclotransferase
MAQVFQYGSNCLDSQINGKDRLCGDAKFIAIAETVEEFQLAFNVWSKGRQCAASDIVVSPGSKVWGALYEVPDFLIERNTAEAQGRKSLDAIEGEGSNYSRETIAVRRDNGLIVTALTYRAKKPKQGIKTSLEYVGYIVKGLRERGVREDYIEHVKKLAQANNRALAAEVIESPVDHLPGTLYRSESS